MSDGPGTPSWRLDSILRQLADRFPEADQPFSSELPEPRFIAAIDKALKPDLFDIVKSASTQADATHGHRTVHDVLAHTMSELGETAEEVNIATGISYKKPGADGVVGEAVDTILCLLDLIHTYDPTITKEQINALAAAKCQKWMRKLDEDANR